MKIIHLLRFFLPFLAICMAPQLSLADTFPVTTNSESGPGSLREAVASANALAGLDTITFSVSGNIILTGATIGISDGLYIDGTSAPGYVQGTPSVNIQHNLSNSVIPIFTFNKSTDDFTVKGLSMDRLGVAKSFCIRVNSANNVVIEYNKFNNLAKATEASSSMSYQFSNNNLINCGSGGGTYAIGLSGNSTSQLLIFDNYFSTGADAIFLQGFDNINIGSNVTDDVIIKPSDNFNSMTGGQFNLVGMSNLTISGLDIFGAGQISIQCSGCDNLDITGNTFTTRAAFITTNCDGVAITNNVITSNSAPMTATGGSDFTIQNNNFISCGGTGTSQQAVLLSGIDSSTTGSMNRITWNNNNFNGGSNAVKFVNMPNLTLSSVGTPEILLTAADGIFTANAVVIQLNTCDGASVSDMDCTNTAETSAVKRGILVQNCAGVSLDALTFARYPTAAVEVKNSANTSITNSLFKCNPVNAIIFTGVSNLGSVINSNNFSENGAATGANVALQNNHASEIYDASNNYWGDPLGSKTDNASSTGDRYSAGLFSGTTTFSTTEFPGLPSGNPSIAVSGNGSPITSGQTTPSLTNHTIFPTAVVGLSTTRTYVIDNTSSDDLKVFRVSSSSSAFSCTTTDVIVPGGTSANIVVTFAPISAGTKTSTIIIENSGCTTTSYSFAVSGLAESCGLAITNVAKTSPSCPGGSDGAISITTSCTTCGTLEYSIVGVNGGAYQASPTFTGLSAGTYTVNVKDASNSLCTDTSSGNVINVGLDTTPPAITCPTNVTVNNDTGVCEATNVTLGTATVTDNCNMSITPTHNGSEPYALGTTTVTWTADDGNGQTATCIQTVTVVDDEDPIASCTDITINLVDQNTYNLSQANIDAIGANSTDNCSTPTYTITAGQTAYDCTDVGTHQVTLTATDGAGLTHMCTATVTIADPNTVCCDIAITSVTPTDEVCPGADDGQIVIAATCTTCTSIEYALAEVNSGAYQASGTFTDLPDGTYTVNVRDAGDNGCDDASSGVVAAGVDTEDPTFEDEDFISLLANDFENPDGAPTSSAPFRDMNFVGGVTAWYGPEYKQNNTTEVLLINGPFNVYSDPANTAGNYSLGIFDDSDPAGQNDLVAITFDRQGKNFINVKLDIGVTGLNSGGAPWTGITYQDANLNLKVYDDPNNTFDVEAPSGTILDEGSAMIDTSGSSIFVLNWETVVIGLDVSGATLDTVVLLFDLEKTLSNGAYVAIDNLEIFAGDSSIENAAPQDTSYQCLGDLPIAPVFEGFDNCDANVDVTYVQNPASPTGNDQTITRTWTLTDDSGNDNIHVQTITIDDTEAPTITCPTNVTINNDAGVCEATNVALGTPTVTDNCNNAIVATNDAPTTFPVGMTTVTWTADDGNGQSATCLQTVMVVDNEAPVLANLPSDITIGCTDALPANTVTTSDNCGNVSGSNATILVDYTDTGWKYMNLSLPTGGDLCEIPMGMELPGFDDSAWPVGGGGFSNDIPFQACGGFPAQTMYPLNSMMVLRREVTLAAGASGMHIKATYDNGFRAYVNGTPVVACTNGEGCDYDRDRTVAVVPDNLLLTGSNSIVIVGYDTGSFSYLDATITLASAVSGLVPFSETSADGEVAGDISIIERSWAVVDAAGNQATHSQKITIQDTEAPVATCTDITVNLVDENDYTLSQTDIDMIGANSTDNCGTPTYTITAGQTVYNCVDVGSSYIVTLTADDGNGNTNSCTAMVTVEDPNTVCCDIAITSATPTDEVCPGADDGQIDVIATCTTCTSIEYSIDDFTTMNTTGDFTGLSDGTFTVKVRDSGDNSCAAEMMNVVVGAGTDTTDPTWTNAPADMTIECDGAGNTTQFNTWLADFNGTDNCGTATVTDNNTGGPTGLCTDCDGTTYTTYADFEAAAIAAGIAVGDIPADPGYAPICGTIITNAYNLSCNSSGACFGAGGTSLGQGTEAQILANFAVTFPGATIASNTINGGCSGFGHGCALPAAASAVINNPEGASVTVLFTLTDENNNAINQTATFTIEDTTAPDVTGALTGVALDGCDDTVVTSAMTTVAAVEAMAGNLDVSDICAMDADITVISSDVTTGVAPLLTVTRTYTFTDPCGNAEIATQVFTVTGLDEIPNNNIDDDCDGAIDEVPSVAWVALPNGTSTGSNGNCVSATDCCTQTFCFGLEYTPGSNGTLTSYTSGFITDCSGGINSIVSNASCVMDDNSLELVDCSNGGVLMNSSGVNGSLAISVNNPVIIHQICVTVLDEETKTFMEDAITDISMAVDLTVGPVITEYPEFDDLTVEGNKAPVLTSGIIEACYASSGNAEAAALAATTGIDDCPGAVTFTASTVGTCSAVVTVTGTDACGLTSTVTYNTKVDGSAPVAIGSAFTFIQGCSVADAPAAVTDVMSIEALSVGVTITDDCTADIDLLVSSSDVIGNACPITITRTYTITDECGNMSVLNHFIVINDADAPTVTGDLADITIAACTAADAPVAATTVAELEALMGGILISDGCTVDGDLTVTHGDNLSGTCPIIITRTYTIGDACLNFGLVNHTIQIDPPNTIMEIGGPVTTEVTVASALYETAPPAIPEVHDGCGNVLTPSPVVIGGTYVDGDCKGTITYTYTYTDCVDQTYEWIYTNIIDCGNINVRAFLEGAYVVGDAEMGTRLNDLHILPGQDKLLSGNSGIIIGAPWTSAGHPYQGSPWNITSTTGDQYGDATAPGAPSGVIAYPDHVVDWILVTVRENTNLASGNVFSCPAWLHTNGDVTFPETCADVLTIDAASDYYIVIEHRNHLTALDTAEIMNTDEYLTVDFTENDSYAPVFRFGQKEIAPGVWGLYNSNIDQFISRTSINSADQTSWKLDQNKLGYNNGDVDLSGAANSQDETKWKINQNKTTGVRFN